MRARSGDLATRERTTPPIFEEVVSRGIERRVDANPGVVRVPLSGSPPVGLPRHILEAVAAPARNGGYAPSSGEPYLREAIAETLRAEGVDDARSDAVLVTNGAMQALDLSFRTLIEPGSSVLLPVPGFFIGGLVERVGGELRGFECSEAAGFRPDWDAVTEEAVAGARILFVNSPVNPTGYVFSDDDLERAVEVAARHDMWIVSDESYSHFVYEGRHRTIACVPGALERTILVRSFSKDYAMPGWRLGYMLLPPELIEPITRTFEWSCLCVNRVAQAAAYAALTGPRDWIDEFVRESGRRGRWVAQEINEIDGLRCVAPAGGLNLLVRSTADAEELVRRLVLEHGVPVHPGEPFGATEHFRLQFGATDDVLREGLARIRHAALTNTSERS